MVKAGLGYGFFPEFSVTDPDLVVRPLVNPSFNRTIYLTTVRGRPHSPAVGAFVQEARRYPWPATRLPAGKIGRAHVCTPVTHAHLACRLLTAKKKQKIHQH